MSGIVRGFGIIKAVTSAGSAGLSFARIVEQTDIPKATAHRLLRDLVALSALRLDPETRHYKGGLLLARVGAEVVAGFDLRETVRPHLKALHEATEHVATLGVRDEDAGVYIDKIETESFGIRMHSEIGKRFPLHCTAMGKVLLGQAEPAEFRQLIRRKLDAYTDNTITDGKKLRAEVERVRDLGFAVDREEITRGLICVAAPVFGADGKVAGAISCTFPSYISDDRGIDAEIAAVQRYAAEASSTPQ